MVPNAFIRTPHIFHDLTVRLKSKTKWVVCISLSQLCSVASVGGAAPNTQWHRFSWEYKTIKPPGLLL